VDVRSALLCWNAGLLPPGVRRCFVETLFSKWIENIMPEDAAQIHPGPRLERTTFSRSRLLDFCSEKELVAQAGHPKEEWPLVIAKEVIDNSLDAIEEAGHAAEIRVKVTPSEICIADNGPGIPAATIEKILDYSVRVSSREAYVSTTRGAQGNALKCIIAMPFVLHGERGRVDLRLVEPLHSQRSA
jgi:hypothetical protein